VICPSALRVSLHSLWCDVLRAGESKAGLEGLVLLLKRIRLIAERGAATPAERLLDDLLRLLDSSEGAYDANEVQEVLHTQASKTLQHHDGAHRTYSLDLNGWLDEFAAAPTNAIKQAQLQRLDELLIENAGKKGSQARPISISSSHLKAAINCGVLIFCSMLAGDLLQIGNCAGCCHCTWTCARVL